jgi:hypothetical protein
MLRLLELSFKAKVFAKKFCAHMPEIVGLGVVETRNHFALS